MKKTITAAVLILVFAGFSSAQTQCEVVESAEASAEIEGETVDLQQGDVLSGDDTVQTENQGNLVVLCSDNQLLAIGPDSEGEVMEVGEAEDIDAGDQLEEDVDFEETLNQTDEIEENLEVVNQEIQENVPESVRSLILGDRVNLEVGDTVIGLETDEEGITNVSDDGLEDPTLEVSFEEETLQNITESDDSMEEFREAFHGDGVDVEAYSWRNRIIFGAVSTGSRVYGFFSDIF